MADTDLFDEWMVRLASQLEPLPDKPEETVENTLRALWQAAAGYPMTAEAASNAALVALDPSAEQRLSELIAQRLAGVPLAHITGRQRFMNRDFLAGPEALVPRKETEVLCQTALGLLANMSGSADTVPLVIDVCTGAGNLAITLALHHPQCRVYAADLSADCVRLTERNIAHFGVTGRVEAAQGDLLEPFDTLDFHAAVDLLTCNPPYISARKLDTMHREIRDFEPRLAFDGGPLGVSVLYRLIKEAPRFLKQGGWLAFEVGLGQGPSVVKRMEKSGDYREVRSVADAAGDIRAVLART